MLPSVFSALKRFEEYKEEETYLQTIPSKYKVVQGCKGDSK